MRTLLLFAILAVAIAAQIPPGKEEVDPHPVRQDPEEAARELNTRAWREIYAPRAPELVASKQAGWVGIVDGEVLPRTGDGRIQPADSLETVEALLDRLAPDARHRYIFQVGEDGDRESFYTLGEWPHGIGQGLAGALARGAKAEFWYTPSGIVLKSEGGSVVISEAGPGGHPRVPLALESPGGGAATSAGFVYCSAFPGPAVVSRETAAKLALARYEIPGTMTLNETRLCRRVRLVFKLGKPAVKVLLDAAVWPL